MPRPKRPGWSKITITISDEVAQQLRHLRVDHRSEIGTIVDQILRKHLKTPHAFRVQLAPTAIETASKMRMAELLGGGKPKRIAEFLCRRNSESDPAPYASLRHLTISKSSGYGVLSPNKFISLVTELLSTAEVEVGSQEEERTVQALNDVLNLVDESARQLMEAFQLHAQWRELWRGNAASSYGRVLGWSLHDTGDVTMAATTFTRCLVKFTRRNDEAFHRLSKESTDSLERLLLEFAPDPLQASVRAKADEPSDLHPLIS